MLFVYSFVCVTVWLLYGIVSNYKRIYYSEQNNCLAWLYRVFRSRCLYVVHLVYVVLLFRLTFFFLLYLCCCCCCCCFVSVSITVLDALMWNHTQSILSFKKKKSLRWNEWRTRTELKLYPKHLLVFLSIGCSVCSSLTISVVYLPKIGQRA